MIRYFHPQRELVDQIEQYALFGNPEARKLTNLWFKLVELVEPDGQMHQQLLEALNNLRREDD